MLGTTTALAIWSGVAGEALLSLKRELVSSNECLLNPSRRMGDQQSGPESTVVQGKRDVKADAGSS